MKQILLLSFGIFLLTSCQKSETLDANISDRPGGVSISGIRIGRQVWSSRNLDVNRYRNGDPIPQVTDQTQWANLTTGAWCWFNNDSVSYAAKYGRLYNWYAVNDPRGLAPQGWHVPTDAEWNKMAKFIDPSVDTVCQCWTGTNVGSLLKSQTGWPIGSNGTDFYGFSALPGGDRNGSGGYFGAGNYGQWWTRSKLNPNSINIWTRLLSNDENRILRNGQGNIYNGFSVRCVKD